VKILVIGATRGVGLQLVQQALARDHEVTVLIRDVGRMPLQNERLRIAAGDILNGASVLKATAGQDAVCVCIGHPPTREPVSLFSAGTRFVLEAMAVHRVRRLVCVTGIGAGDSFGHGGFLFDKILFPLWLRQIYEDKNRQESMLRSSNLDWVIVRPGFLTNGPKTEHYRVLHDLHGVTAGKISRADVAHFMLRALEDDSLLRTSPLLTY
jgi:putative NADH-flavin reductase